jgi:NAD(P)-dependent dehydrogenase (short-subunit alcohol dehydrogenase family)
MELSLDFLSSALQTLTIASVTAALYRAWRFQYLLKKDMQGKTVLITGGASGVGLETCQLFARNGWRVIALDINSKGLEELRHISPQITTYVVDISSVESIDLFLDLLSKNSEVMRDGIDALVNCAGVVLPGPCLGVSWERMELQFRVNIIGVVYLTKKLLPFLLQNGQGASIVNISSMAGSIAWPWQGAYSTSKYALEGQSVCGLVLSLL